MKRTGIVLDMHERRRPQETTAPAGRLASRRGAKAAGRLAGRAGAVSVGGATQGSLALQAAINRKPRPTPGRWFSEAHTFLGFRLWDIVYIFAIARQCELDTEDALGWGMRYWAGGLDPGQDLAVIDLLAPGTVVPEGPGSRRMALDSGFVAAIRQGAGQLLGDEYDGELPVEEAVRLQWLLEGLYAREGWRLPAMPFALQLRLRKAKERPDGF